eukprot:3004969-Ditylum_brightwellii.AAC.1
MLTFLAATTDGTSTSTNGTTSSSPLIGDSYFGAHHARLLSLISVSSISPYENQYVQFELFLKEVRSIKKGGIHHR